MTSFTQACDKFITYYITIANESNNLQQEVIEQDLPNITQTFRFISQKSDPKLSYSFWEAISDFLWNKFYWHLYKDWGIKTLEIVSRTGNYRLEEAWLCSEQGWIAMDWGDYDLAQNLFFRSEHLFRNIILTDYRGLCIILRYQGVLNFRRGNFILSAGYLSEAERIAVQHHFDVMLSEIYNLQASIARKEGNLENASSLYYQSAKVLREIGNSWYLPAVMRNLALLEKEKGDLNKAKSILLDAIQICKQERHFDILYSCKLALAELELQMGNLGEAYRMADEASEGFILLGLGEASEHARAVIARINNPPEK